MCVYVCECVSQIGSILVEIWLVGLLRYGGVGVHDDGGISDVANIFVSFFPSLQSIIFVCPVHKKFTQAKVQEDVSY